MAEISPITVARFWSKVAVKQSKKECWEWLGSSNPGGYGHFRVPQMGRGVVATHRLAYCLYNGGFPDDGLVVRHRCDNPKCVNPLHLEKGTVRDNIMDAVERGRLVPRDQKGEKNGAAKLTAEMVIEIKRRIAKGHNNTMIASDFGVGHAMISRIKLGKSWAHLQA